MNLVHSAESAVLREEALIVHLPKKAFRATAELLINAEPVSTQHSNGDIFAMFEKSPELGVIPVIDQRKPVGLINRNAFMQNMARPFFRELYLRKPCTALMDKAPLIVTSHTSIEELSAAVLSGGGKALQDGFVITDRDGFYQGVGTGLDMVQALSDLQAEKNRQVMESIDYASVIQKSLGRHSRQSLRETLPDHFLMWEPRDIVAGDYFFFQKFEHGFFGALFDCTGHGVPGAFMTMIMSSFLQNAITADNWQNPSEILGIVNRKVKAALDQIDHSHSDYEDSEEHASDDGMDAAFFAFDQTTSTLTFAGAHMPMLVLPPLSDTLVCYEGNRAGVGYATTAMNAHWDNHQVVLERGSQVYFYTDGIVDQLGGPKRLAFGKRRLHKVIMDNRHQPMSLQRAALHEALMQYQGEQVRKDDVSAMGFRLQ